MILSRVASLWRVLYNITAEQDRTTFGTAFASIATSTQCVTETPVCENGAYGSTKLYRNIMKIVWTVFGWKVFYIRKNLLDTCYWQPSSTYIYVHGAIDRNRLKVCVIIENGESYTVRSATIKLPNECYSIFCRRPNENVTRVNNYNNSVCL